MLFKEMDLDPKIIQALEENQIASPTEIQEQCIPHGISMRKSHVIGQAKTGSGKTLAFAIPIIEKINKTNRHIQAVVIVPTRELCKQNASVFRSITKYKKVKIVEVYGGASIRVQIEQIKNGGQVIVATPGRLIDLIKRGELNFKSVNFVALDEADRMLDMGFLPDIEYVLFDAMKNVSPRLFLFSATLMEDIKRVIRRFTRNEEVHEIDVSKDSLTVDNCDQYAYYVDDNKFKHFVNILNEERPDFSIVFTKTKRSAEAVCRKLKREHNLTFKFKPGFIHGDVTQAQREKTVEQFRKRQINCLVGTNVLARGLDFPKVSHVFNYDMPRDPEDYVHRIGRTARTVGVEKNVANGKAISIVSNDSRTLMRKVERLLKYNIKKRTVPQGAHMRYIPKDRPSSSRKSSRNFDSEKKYGSKPSSSRKPSRNFDSEKKYGSKPSSSRKPSRNFDSEKKYGSKPSNSRKSSRNFDSEKKYGSKPSNSRKSSRNFDSEKKYGSKPSNSRKSSRNFDSEKKYGSKLSNSNSDSSSQSKLSLSRKSGRNYKSKIIIISPDSSSQKAPKQYIKARKPRRKKNSKKFSSNNRQKIVSSAK